MGCYARHGVTRWFAMVVLSGCSLLVDEPLELEGRPCPCSSGYTCVEERCVAAVDGGAVDGAVDADLEDAPLVDGSADAGPSDAGDGGQDAALDAQGDSGPELSRCEAAIGRRVLLCDDFEDGLDWEAQTNTFGMVGRTSFGAQGRVLEASTSTVAGVALARRQGLSLSGGEVWAKAWVRPLAPTFPSAFNMREALSLGSAGARDVRVLIGDSGELRLQVLGEIRNGSMSPASADDGFCVRLHVELSTGADGVAELYLGSEKVAEVLDMPTVTSGVQSIWAGVDTMGIFGVQVDDVAVDTEELVCP